jgi:hypothetical protein
MSAKRAADLQAWCFISDKAAYTLVWTRTFSQYQVHNSLVALMGVSCLRERLCFQRSPSISAVSPSLASAPYPGTSRQNRREIEPRARHKPHYLLVAGRHSCEEALPVLQQLG